jgi:UPF0716 protein FxsA
MFPRLLFLFIFLPMVELYLLIVLGSRIGAMPTIGLIVLTGVIGATLARQQGVSTLSKIQNELRQGRAPARELLEGALIVVGGIVLLTPGILTDLFGFSLLIAPIRRALCEKLSASFLSSTKEGKSWSNVGFGSFKKNSDDIIDV